ncbi:hypothetical protein BKA62DRAFT_755086 [Auriculariales sp. MPI-PUGE-AT-0066]|nr:hypothetical protein BKA62DRAFT_755086 [Auriculariales sp. MPI-PUGE-AT-0066]
MDLLDALPTDAADEPIVPREPAVVVPYSIQLPDELVRKIFEHVVCSSVYTARHLMLVSRWVRTWLITTFYETQNCQTRADLERLLRRPDSILARIRNLRVNIRNDAMMHELFLRAPNVERLAVPIEALSHRQAQPFPDEMAATLREVETVAPDYNSGLDCIIYKPAFSAVTHLRLAYPLVPIVTYLTKGWTERNTPSGEELTVVVLPALTHLAFDATYLYSCQDAQSSVENLVNYCQRIVNARRGTRLGASTTAELQVLALVLAPTYALEADKSLVYIQPRPELRPARPEDRGLYNFRQYLLESGIPGVKVLQTASRKTVGRFSDWKARANGESGFWERIECEGQVGVPRLAA